MSTATTKPSVRPEPATLQLALYPNAILKKPARDVAHFDDWLQAVVERMIQIMVENKGVGLAAPQVGLSLRLFIASPEGKPEETRVYINPVLSDEHGSEEAEEGCLSLPDIRTKVVRFTKIRIEALDARGKPFAENPENFPARILQHENDHLEGILLLDRMSPIAKLANRKKIKELEAAAPAPPAKKRK